MLTLIMISVYRLRVAQVTGGSTDQMSMPLTAEMLSMVPTQLLTEPATIITTILGSLNNWH